MAIRIFEVTTETPSDNQVWGRYNIAAKHADEAITKAKKKMSEAIEERVVGVKLIASEN